MGLTSRGALNSSLLVLLAVLGALVHCTTVAGASNGASVVGGGRALQQAGNSTCPFVFKPSDVSETIDKCRKFNTSADPNGALFNLPCCNRITYLFYQVRVRHANATDRLLISQDEAQACVTALQALLADAGIPGGILTECGLDVTPLWQPTCGADLTTVSAFRQLGNNSYPGSAAFSCWNQQNCTTCVSSINQKIAALKYTAVGDPTVFASTQCQDLAQIAAVASARPLLLANSIAFCLWETPIDYVAQSQKCTSLDFSGVNFTSIYNSCGPLQLRSTYCCTTIQAMYTQLYATWTNATGFINNEADAVACLDQFRTELATRGIDPSKVDTCRLNSYAVVGLLQCKNFTDLPPTYIPQLESRCSPGQCANCSQALFGVVSKLTGPLTDQLTFVYCSTFVGAHYYHFFGPGGLTDRINCYFNLPPEVSLTPAVNKALPTGRTDRRPDRTNTLVAVTVSCVVGLGIVLLAVGGLVLWSRKRRLRKGRGQGKRKMVESLSHAQHLSPLQWFTYQELKAATNNFDKKLWLGKGGSGMVYLGTLPGGQLVAVKEITKPSTQRGIQEFLSEISSLSSCRHRHIVAPRGVHASDDHCVVIYEYISNGSLDFHLFTPRHDAILAPGKRVFLDWPTRLKIALGTAKGLAYLHEDCLPRIIHRDVKPSNILLNEDWDAKVADFGLAKFTQDDETHVSTGVRGTWGYISPEYVAHGQVSEKSDVYGFGVVLLSLVSGRRPRETEREEGQVFLTEWAWEVADRGDFLSIVEPGLASALPEHSDSILTAIKVGLICVHTVVSFRPTMRECVAMLLQNIEVPPLPQRPITLFTVPSDQASSSFGVKSVSDNHGSTAGSNMIGQ